MIFDAPVPLAEPSLWQLCPARLAGRMELASEGDLRMPLVEVVLAGLGLAGVDAEPMAGGSSLPVYRVGTRDGDVFALRVAPPPLAPVLIREAENLARARLAEVPCPRVVRTAPGPDAAFLLTTWEPGRLLGEALVSNPSAITELAMAAGRVQAALHRTGAAAAAETCDAGWASPKSPEERALLDACAQDGPVTFLHLDFHPFNLLVHEGAITAVLDWVNAGVGDARLDVARTAAALVLDGARPDSPVAPVVPVLLRDWIRGYEDAAGRLREMGPYLIWAGTATIRVIHKSQWA